MLHPKYGRIVTTQDLLLLDIVEELKKLNEKKDSPVKKRTASKKEESK